MSADRANWRGEAAVDARDQQVMTTWGDRVVVIDVEMPGGQLRTSDPNTGAVCCATVTDSGEAAAITSRCC